jgi:hypothetical protein
MSDNIFGTQTTGWQQGTNGSGNRRSQNEPHPPISPVLLALLCGGAILFIVVVGVLIWRGSSSAAPVAVHAPAVQATTAPAPVSTPIPTAPTGATYTAIEMVDQLISERQYNAAALMAEKALKTVQLSSERTALQERVFSAKLHALVAAPVSVLNVSAQQQVVNHYGHLQQEAADAGVSFPTHLAGAKLAIAQDAEKYLLSKTLLERAYGAGEFTKADQETLRLYRTVLYRMGWLYAAQGSDARKAEGLQVLAASCALEQEQGITHGWACLELIKYKGADKRNWPAPIKTPLLTDTNEGGS